MCVLKVYVVMLSDPYETIINYNITTNLTLYVFCSKGSCVRALKHTCSKVNWDFGTMK